MIRSEGFLPPAFTTKNIWTNNSWNPWYLWVLHLLAAGVLLTWTRVIERTLPHQGRSPTLACGDDDSSLWLQNPFVTYSWKVALNQNRTAVGLAVKWPSVSLFWMSPGILKARRKAVSGKAVLWPLEALRFGWKVNCPRCQSNTIGPAASLMAVLDVKRFDSFRAWLWVAPDAHFRPQESRSLSSWLVTTCIL